MAPSLVTPPVDRLLARLEKVKRSSEGWVACCPAHDDDDPSLSIAVGRDGRALVTCHAGCDLASIVAAAGLEMSDLFPERVQPIALHPVQPLQPVHRSSHSSHKTSQNGANGARVPLRVETSSASAPAAPAAEAEDGDEARDWPVVATYDYVDADGQLVFQVTRHEPPVQPASGKRKKTFRQQRPAPNGWIRSIKDIALRPLYRLPELVEDLAHERTILLVEGEKDCNTLRDLGFPATTHSGGAKGWRPEYAQQLAGASVIILPDNDEPGRDWAATAGESLVDAGATVKMFALPITMIGGDATDWVEAGGTGPQLERLIGRAVPWSIGDPVPLPLAPSRFKLLSVRELEQMPSLEWLMGRTNAGILPASSLVGIFGAPGAGKSFITADLACTIACRRADVGKRWFGHAVRRGPVLYIVAEGGRGFSQRVRAWRDLHDVTEDDLAVKFLPEPVNLFESEDISHLLRAVDEMPVLPVLVIFDTLARSMVGGDENSAKDVGLVIDRAERLKRETGATCALVHHAKKDGDVERGSGALRAGVDTLCMVREDEDNGRVLTCEKQKDADPFDPITFFLHPVGESCAISAQAPAGLKTLTANQRTALKTLADVFPKGATSTEWLKTSGLAERSFFRTKAWLVRNGYVSELERGQSHRYSILASGTIALDGGKTYGLR